MEVGSRGAAAAVRGVSAAGRLPGGPTIYGGARKLMRMRTAAAMAAYRTTSPPIIAMP